MILRINGLPTITQITSTEIMTAGNVGGSLISQLGSYLDWLVAKLWSLKFARGLGVGVVLKRATLLICKLQTIMSLLSRPLWLNKPNVCLTQKVIFF